MKPTTVEADISTSTAESRRVDLAVARCLADLDARGEYAAPFDRAAEVITALVPALHTGDADGARAAVLGSDLPTRELLDLVLRARASIRRRRARAQQRADCERAADSALRALADRDDPSHPEDLDRRRQIASTHRRLLALFTDGVLTARPDGTLMHANRAARDALGLKLRELLEVDLKALFATPAEFRSIWQSVTKDGRSRAREVDLKSAAGRTFPARVTAARADGPDPRVLVLFRDLTEIRHIRSRLIETEKLGAMAKIAGSVAHEIRNPLNTLFLNIDLLEDELGEADQPPPEPIEETLGVMREEIERLNDIIKNYLSLSKLTNANFERLDLNQIAREFSEEVEDDALRRDVKFELRLCRGQALVRADRNMLRRVLVNLVQNAYDATPAGGKVILGTRRLLRNVKLWVRDSGGGVPAEAEEQVFEPFFSTKDRGTGLGLYLIREIVMAHDGKVALRSIKPHGAQATVLLPRLRGETNGKEHGE